ncbi:MAG: type II toxin-antitoxin system VapC family toxin, partial [Chloroflexia bacterium]
MIVVDASAAVKWFFVEERSVQARAILRAVLVGSENVVAPPLLVSEVVNAIRRRMFREALPLSEARQFVSAFLDVPKTLWSPDRLYIRALEVAEEYNLPAAYDTQ